MEKYNWDLSLMYSHEDEFYSDLHIAEDLLLDLKSRKDVFLSSLEEFLVYHEHETELSRKIAKLYCFASMNCDTLPAEPLHQGYLASILSLLEKVSSELDFYQVMMIENSDVVNEYLKDDCLSEYRYSLSTLLKEKEHTLSKEEETILSKCYGVIDTCTKVFDSLRLEFDPVVINGRERELNSATLSEFLKHKDANVRMQAYHNFFKEYKKFENTFAETLSSVMKKDAFIADVRKFSDPLEASLFNDHVPVSLFYKILDKANNQYRHLFHKYNSLKKKYLKLDVMYNYDLNIPFINYKTKKYSIDECFDIILDVTKVFGKEYTDIIESAREERWIDFYPAKGKRAGAYSNGCFDSRPYILMNFIGDYNSLSTMIHELGHSAHTYLSCKYQSPVNSDYKIFVAEVASTVNEALLINYMLEHASSKEEKAYFLYEQLESCVGLLFRQPMFADFEHELHNYAKDHIPMSAKTMTDLYTKKNQEYFGDDVVLDEYVGCSCFYVPHFYYNYYVYKYTLGMTCALAIVSRLLKGDVSQRDSYLSFLKSGGSMDPVDLLKLAGVNPLEDDLYDEAYSYFNCILEQFEEIMG